MLVVDKKHKQELNKYHKHLEIVSKDLSCTVWALILLYFWYRISIRFVSSDDNRHAKYPFLVLLCVIRLLFLLFFGLFFFLHLTVSFI